MRLWFRKKKQQQSVEFARDMADQTLLAAVQAELEKQPDKTFGDLCKEALWQFLYVSESLLPVSKVGQLEEQIASIQERLASVEERIGAREASRLNELESQIRQLSLQMGQLAISGDRSSAASSPRAASPLPVPPKPEPEPEPENLPPPQPIDPLLSRLGSLLDDF